MALRNAAPALAALTAVRLLSILATAQGGEPTEPQPRQAREQAVIVVGARPVRDGLLLLCQDHGRSAVYRDPVYDADGLEEAYPGGPRGPVLRRLVIDGPAAASFRELCRLLCRRAAAFDQAPGFNVEPKDDLMVISGDAATHPFWKEPIGDLADAQTIRALLTQLNALAKNERAPYTFTLWEFNARKLGDAAIALRHDAPRATIPEALARTARDAGLPGVFWEELGAAGTSRTIVVRPLSPPDQTANLLVSIRAYRPMTALFEALAGQLKTPIVGFEGPALTRPDTLLTDADGKVWGPRGGVFHLSAANADEALRAALRQPQPTGLRYACLFTPQGTVAKPYKVRDAQGQWHDARSPLDRQVKLDRRPRSAWDWLTFCCDLTLAEDDGRVLLAKPTARVRAQLERKIVSGAVLPTELREIVGYLLQQADTTLRWLTQYEPVAGHWQLHIFSTRADPLTQPAGHEGDQ